jgi:hypothetical protein
MVGVYASPNCPACGKTMAFYDYGTQPADPRPVPPPLPDLGKPSRLSTNDIDIYSGNCTNPGHGLVTWEITRNAAAGDMTIRIMCGPKGGGNYVSDYTFKLADGLLAAQNGDKKDWWLNAPFSAKADKAVWYSLDLKSLIGEAKLGGLPAVIEIGVKLGNGAFGLIHLLAGHAGAVRNIGSYKIDVPADKRDDVYRTLLSLQLGLQRFSTTSISEIYYEETSKKLLIKGSHSGFVVITRTDGSPRYSITTLYNTESSLFGNKIYQRS